MNYTLYALVALGGAMGALSRFVISTWVYNKYTSSFPLGTLVVNVSGSFLLGLVYYYSVEKLIINPNLRTFITIGFLGAYTTFSTLSLETLNMLNEGEFKSALLNGLGSLLAGLAAVWIGISLARLLSR